MSEIIDIYDADLRPMGVMDRKLAHLEGQWHRTFHCWVFSGEPSPSVLFQRRAPTMKNFPNMLDVSAAGHLSAGEPPVDGIREVREELGIPIDIDELEFAGERVEVADQTNGQRNREYQSVYFSRQDSPLSEYNPDPGEIWGLFWVKIDDLVDVFVGNTTSVPAVGIEYSAVSKQFEEASITVGQQDFLPRIQRYYLAAAVCAERLLAGERTIAIS